MITWLSPQSKEPFPPVEEAMDDPNGLLAAGGDLSPERLLAAYQKGIFPWFGPGEPILWWCPQPRTVIFPNDIHISRRLARTLRQQRFKVRLNQHFGAVIRACAEPRRGQYGTWITSAMINAYEELHALGYAHCLEIWQQQRLIGGIYGVALGRVFFGESMFSRERDASKLAMILLCKVLQYFDFPLLDCQVASDHLFRMGARNISRQDFTTLLDQYVKLPLDQQARWHSPPLSVQLAPYFD